MFASMRSEHIPAVVKIHQDSFSDSFLTQLGTQVLTIIYTEFSKSGFAYVYLVDGEAAAFWAGTYTPALLFYKNLLFAHPFRLSALLLLAVLRSPGLAKSILARAGRMLRPSPHPKRDDPVFSQLVNSHERIAFSLTIAVSPRHRGKGLGAKIYTDGIRDLAATGVYAIIGTVISDNTAMNIVHEKAGYKKLTVLDRVDGKQEIKWLHYQRGCCSISESGLVTWFS
jgi:GNAT superfamily N-acetyltransferase